MNITDLIVEMLEKGQQVILPGIGTLDNVMQNAHHDPKTQTYYPTSRIIVYNESVEGECDIVKEIAARECIGEDVAKQMWANYVDALTDKLRRTGSHTLGRLGTLTCEGKKNFSFAMTEGLMLGTDEKGEVPLTEVKTYAHDGEEDPFAQFDEEPAATLVEPQAEESEPEPKPESEPEPKTDSSVTESWREELKQLDEIPQSEVQIEEDAKAAAKAEKERIKAEKKAEIERLKQEKKAEEERRFAEEMLAKERAAERTREDEERRKAELALRKAEKEAEKARRKAEKSAAANLAKAEKEALKAEKKAAALAAVAARENAKAEAAANIEQEREAARLEKERRKEEERAEKERRKEEARAEKERRQAEKEAAKAEKAAAKQARKNKALADELMPVPPAKEEGEEEEKKKRRVWPIILIVLAVLLLGCLIFLLLQRCDSDKPTVPTKHLADVAATNSLTYNCDMIDYSNNEIMRQRTLVCLFMDEYINTFLSGRNYSSARASMKDRVRAYADQRLNELLGPRFAAQRLLSYEDYIYAYNEPFMKGRYADSARCIVQGELMDYEVLDNILYRMADELGLEPDGQGGKKSAAEVQQVKENERQALANRNKQKDGEIPVYVYIAKGSKLGYDLIAGFYLNKNTAAKMTARLHEQGCDAYIIEVNDMYYVSMGSVSNQTAADALLKHVKSWYDGDVVIRKW